MPTHKSSDYKLTAVQYYLVEDKTQEEVCKIFKCSPRSLKEQHPNYALVKVNLLGACESEPPLNYYDFNFQDDNGLIILLK